MLLKKRQCGAKQNIEKTPSNFQLLFLCTFSVWADGSWLKSSRLSSRVVLFRHPLLNWKKVLVEISSLSETRLFLFLMLAALSGWQNGNMSFEYCFSKKTVERCRVYGSGFVCRVSALRIKCAFSEDLKEEEEEGKKSPLEHRFLVCFCCCCRFCFVCFLLLIFFLLSGLIYAEKA